MMDRRNKQTCAIHTVGCRLNQADSALIADDLVRRGYRLVPWGTPADLLIVNGCAVTAIAEQKTRQAVHAARRRNPAAFMVVAGCAATLQPDAWAADAAVDLVAPNPGKTRLGQALPADLRRPSRAAVLAASGSVGTAVGSFAEQGCGLYPDKTRANLKIQEGCDAACSYCIVPRTRGPERSRAWPDVRREARELLERGHREIILTGVNIARYHDSGRDLADLAAELLALDQSFRLRLSSTEPGQVVPRLVELMAREPRLCRFLHLPMQYAEDSILRAMNRGYTVAEFGAIVTAAAAQVPCLCVGTDFLVGFPGETDAAFEATCRNAAALPFSYFHVFSYSVRPGTPAAAMPGRVTRAAAARRHERLASLGRAQAVAFAERNVGAELDVLVEAGAGSDGPGGWSDNYLWVRLPQAVGGPAPNTVARVRVNGVLGPREVCAKLLHPPMP
jgi:threonylcarbamoyladenosine tRNA methylthiotransferase MtaB